jgi:predicted AAA+ superfamily ATPase
MTLDDFSVLTAVRRDPAGFLAGFHEPLVIDEVQKATDLFVAIKASVDRDRQPGRFLLTGSANILLLPRLSESLAGRMEILNLWPFSQGELIGSTERFVDTIFEDKFPLPKVARKNHFDIMQKVIAGGYPEAILRKAPGRRRAWFSSYITAILQRDIRELANIEGLADVPKLLTLIAVRVPTLLNLAELSRTAAIPQTTLKRYITLLEATFLIHKLQPWFGHLGKRLVKTPKLILSDTGLKAHLLGAGTERMIQNGLIGPYLENFVAMELRKQITWSECQPQMYHFRTQTGHEVDIVLEDARGKVVGIEVKSGTRLGEQDFKGLRVLQEVAGEHFQRGIVLYTGSEVIPFGLNLYALPMDHLWSSERSLE